MTQLQLDEILANPKLDEVIKALQVSSFNIPKWSDLEKQYDPLQHKIFDKNLYPQKLNENNGDDFKRTPLALQKLAVNRISQAQFATPAERTYNIDQQSEGQKTASAVIEEIYRTQNSIDSSNIERAKRLNASCQVATVWNVYEKENIVEALPTKFKLSHTSFSEMDGYKIYANIDNNRNLIVVSFEYKDSQDVEHFDVYVNGENPQFISYTKGEEWALTEGLKQNPQPLEVYPVVYTYLKEPVWGGEAGTNKVEALEELLSFQGLYIKKNSAPLFARDMGDTSGMISKTDTQEKSDAARKIIDVGKGGSIAGVVWEGGKESVDQQFERLRNAYFEEIQLPDTSFANLIKSNTSAENKELVFSDVKAKAIDLSGEWEKLFYEELNEIVIPFLKIMFPSLVADLDAISVRTTIRPYSVKSKKENAEYVATAGDSMSLKTKVATLGEVTDVDEEVQLIQEERGAQINQL